MLNIYKKIIQAIVKTIDNDGVEHAGYMSFMVLLSMFPFIIFFIALTSYLGSSELGTYFIDLILISIPENSVEIKNHISEMSISPPQSLMTLAIIGNIWTSSSFVEALRTILNRIYNVNSPPPYIMRRMMSIAQFFLINLILYFTIFSLILLPIGISKIPQFQKLILHLNPFWIYCRYIAIFISLFLVVSLLYYSIPNIKIQYKMVIPGSVVTVLTWFMISSILKKYITYFSNFNLVYGSLGNIIITLLFFYIINILFIFGATLNYTIYNNKN